MENKCSYCDFFTPLLEEKENYKGSCKGNPTDFDEIFGLIDLAEEKEFPDWCPQKNICPNCRENIYFEEIKNVNNENSKAFFCMNCGYTSSSEFIEDSEKLNLVLEKSPLLIKQYSICDNIRYEIIDGKVKKQVWIPSSLNYKSGIIFPEIFEGKLIWTASKYGGDTDIKSFTILEFRKACEYIGLKEQ